jgi:hypothetical protein
MWSIEKSRAKWLPASSVQITKTTPPKSLRMKWTANDTRLTIDFYPKKAAKYQVVVQHMKLPSSSEAVKMKKYWGKKLDELKRLIE